MIRHFVLNNILFYFAEKIGITWSKAGFIVTLIHPAYGFAAARFEFPG